MARLVVKDRHQKNMCYDDLEDITILGSIVKHHNGEGLFDWLRRKRIFTLTSYNFASQLCFET